jgi:uncharacterized protein (TIGR03435 family)
LKEATMIVKLLLQIGLGGLLAVSAAWAQPATPLAFEVATIKPSAPLDLRAISTGTAHIGTKIDAARVDIGTASLFRLICTAYRLKPYQVLGPEWLKSTMYDIQAKIPASTTADKVPEMLQTLLVERFGLKIHRESKDQPVYALVVAKGGPKLKESAPDPASPSPAAEALEKAKPVSMALPTAQGDIKLTRSAEGISIEMPGAEISGKVRASVNRDSTGTPLKLHLESSGTSMKSFAEMLSVGVVDRPVVDKTGLTGNYELAVDISREEAMNVVRASVSYLPIGGDDARTSPGGAASDPSGSSIFSSIQNLGLRLEARKLPLDMLVVDHIDKSPTEN